MRRVNKGMRTIAHLIKHHADVLEEAFRASVHPPEGGYQVWHLGAVKLSVTCGGGRLPSESSYYSLVRINTATIQQKKLGGVWGAPCREQLVGVIEVPKDVRVVADFLVSRGWRHVGDDDWMGGRLLSPPDPALEGDRDLLIRCYQLAAMPHPNDTDHQAYE